MKQQFRLGFLLFLILSACSTVTQKDHSVSSTPVLSANRTVASNELFWFAHPCGDTKSVPFRKYHSFALDATTGQIYGRFDEAAAPVEIKDKAHSGNAWQNLKEFFDEKGITAACPSGPPAVADGTTVAPTGSTPPAPGTSTGNHKSKKRNRDDFKPPADLFVGPITEDVASYYAPFAEFLQHETGDSSPQFKVQLGKILSGMHLQTKDKPDQLVEQCTVGKEAESACVHQRVFDYAGARRVMFGDVAVGDLHQSSNGDYEVYDYYCQSWRSQEEFSKATNNPNEIPGPGHIVTAKLMNTEHTWPQSKFPDPKGSQMNLVEKTDLHHIFPTDTKVNADRGNFEFSEVNHETAAKIKCSDGFLGDAVLVAGTTATAGQKYFEPPTAHKGDVARALFYFSTRYNAGMSSLQEAYLRKWHQQDPPDEREIKRNEALYHVMGVRNPYIDHPEWVAHVSRFCRAKLAETQTTTDNDCP